MDLELSAFMPEYFVGLPTIVSKLFPVIRTALDLVSLSLVSIKLMNYCIKGH